MAVNAAKPFTGHEWFNVWFKGASDFWAVLNGLGPTSAEPSRLADAVEATRRIFQAGMGSQGPDPASWNAFAKTFQALPEISAQLLQNAVDGYLEMGRRWSAHLEAMGHGASQPFDFKDLDKEFLSRWSDLYKDQFQRLLQIPQLGPGKFFLEKFNAVVDAANLAQTAGMEFGQLLLAPVEKALRVLHQQLADLAEKGQAPQDPKAVYGLWIKTLEGHYMTLFKSPQYTAALARTVDACNNLVAARQAAAADWLRLVPAPSLEDMDELARDLYHLKRRVRELEAALAENRMVTGDK